MRNDVFCWDDLPISDILCEWSIHSSFLTSASPIPLSYLVVSDGLLDSQHCTGQLWSLECEPLIMALACNISANVSAKDPLVFYYSRHYHFHSNHGHCYFWYFFTKSTVDYAQNCRKHLLPVFIQIWPVCELVFTLITITSSIHIPCTCVFVKLEFGHNDPLA